MNKIVVGYDGTAQARDALALAEALHGPLDAELVVAVVDELEPLFGDVPGQLKTRDEFFADTFDEVAGVLGGSGFTRQTGAGSAAGELDRILSESGADLVVVGSTHRGPVGRVLPGSVAERLLAGASSAVMIAPRGYADHDHPRFGLVGVGYDGGEEARGALGLAAGLARALDAGLRVITATPTVEALAPGRIAKAAPAYAAALGEQLAAELDAATRDLDDLDVDTALREGDPAAVLADQSVELDLLVVGSRRYGPLRRVLVGSVAAEIARSAACPVLVAPRAGGD
jgi:nucleotide-binding universal stress UspA family protein